MHQKVLFAALFFGGLAAGAAGFYAVNNAGNSDGLLSRYGAAISETFRDIFGLQKETTPVLEIPLGEIDDVPAPPAAAKPVSPAQEIFPRNLGIIEGRTSAILQPAANAAKAREAASVSASVPNTGAFSATIASAQYEKININTAGLAELQKITGVGPAIAQRIVDYRKGSGPFRVIEDIQKVSGIGPATFEKMKDEITVGDIIFAASPSAGAENISAESPPSSTTTNVSSATTFYPMRVSYGGGGGGAVISSPAGINCGSACVADFTAGAEIVLTATADENSFFSGWSGACSGGGACALIVNSPLEVGATFLPQSQPVIPPSPAETASTGKILISEIFYDASGGDTGKEFIELYNTGSIDIDLSGWSLKRDGTSLASIGSKAEDKKVIKAGGFFLVGLNGYNGTPAADVVRSASLPNTSATVELYDANGNMIDSVNYNNSVSEGQSYERQPLTESGQFAPQPNPSPQNSGG